MDICLTDKNSGHSVEDIDEKHSLTTLKEKVASRLTPLTEHFEKKMPENPSVYEFMLSSGTTI